MAETNIGNIIGAAAEKLKELAGTETVIGNPIVTANGTTVIPVSKVSVGIASGGIDYNSKKAPAKASKNFGGGGGTGVSVTPIGFLVVDAEGGVDMININNPTNDLGSSIESIMEKLPGILDKVKDALSSGKKTEEANKEGEAAAAPAAEGTAGDAPEAAKAE